MADRQNESPLEQGRHDTEIRRETQVREALGIPPTDDEPKVTPESDVFKDQPPDQSER